MNRVGVRGARLVIAAAIAAIVPAAGCSSGIDLTGTYQVTVHTADATGCTNQVAVADPAYVRFEQADLLGHTYFTLGACTDPAQVNCPSAGLYGLYAEEIHDGWRAELGLAQVTGGCILDYSRSEATLVDDTQLVIEGRRYHDESVRPDAECTGTTAIELGDTMPCAGAEHLEATLVTPG